MKLRIFYFCCVVVRARRVGGETKRVQDHCEQFAPEAVAEREPNEERQLRRGEHLSRWRLGLLAGLEPQGGWPESALLVRKRKRGRPFLEIILSTFSRSPHTSSIFVSENATSVPPV